MDVLGIVRQIVAPVASLIDSLHTSDEERAHAREALARVENEAAARLLEYERRLLDARAQIIVAEAQGSSWLQRSWRPITMLTFLALVVFDSFGLLAFRLSDEAWALLKIGLGGYVIGRSGEKIVARMKGGDNA